jgi:hypothetical protein
MKPGAGSIEPGRDPAQSTGAMVGNATGMATMHQKDGIEN